MLQELNKESQLLLYVADELSPRDRADVDALLAADPLFQADLDRLEATIGSFDAGMAELDEMPLPSEASAIRNIGQLMRQRLTEQAVRGADAAPAVQPRMKYPWWAYPAVGAAVVLICFVSWWGNRPDQPLKLPSDGGNRIAVHPGPLPGPTADDGSRLADEIQRNFEASNPTQPAKSVASLDAAENQIAELSRAQTDFSFPDGNE
ncbi:MAG TPA: hypothetical protein VFE47_19465 [Tepidisphaeraceae bacterium]|nr:hypothetical protein [Tepidisphaeraceae bacterium]